MRKHLLLFFSINLHKGVDYYIILLYNIINKEIDGGDEDG